MGFALVHARVIVGIEAQLVSVETHTSGGLPRFTIVGLAAAAVKESKERVRSALINSHFKFPASRITVNLSPADLPKAGGGFDLAIAISVLAATGQISKKNLLQFEFNAELGLGGQLKPVPIILPHALALWRQHKDLDSLQKSSSKEPPPTVLPNNINPLKVGVTDSDIAVTIEASSVEVSSVATPSVAPPPIESSPPVMAPDTSTLRQKKLCIATANRAEASICDPDLVLAYDTLLDVTAHFSASAPSKSALNHAATVNTQQQITAAASLSKTSKHEQLAAQRAAATGRISGMAPGAESAHEASASQAAEDYGRTDLSQVVGQTMAKRALFIAAAGEHSLLFCGSPGVGKTLLANCLRDLLPPLDDVAALEVASVYACSKLRFDSKYWRLRPFRSPHHTCSYQALVGGGRPPEPGEISLAHRGVLFLDELPEFQRQSLEALREPLEARRITISRAAFQVKYPAAFQLLAAMNPCPCGYAASRRRQCHCSAVQIQRYMHKLSGPFLDRIDMHVMLNEPDNASLQVSLRQAVVTAESISDAAFVLDHATTAQLRRQVIAVQQRQLQRQGCLNSHLNASPQAARVLSLDPAAEDLLQQAMVQYQLSSRHYHRLLKLARTIADMAVSDVIAQAHLAEALSLLVQPSTWGAA